MNPINANDLKIKGVAAIEAALAEQPEAVIAVRGKQRFVVMDLDHYHYLRECELEAALAETRADLAAGRAVVESPEAHLARLDALDELRARFHRAIQSPGFPLPQTPSGTAPAISENLATAGSQPVPPVVASARARREIAGAILEVSINLFYRITLELLVQEGQIIPVNVGDHEAVYSSR